MKVVIFEGVDNLGKSTIIHKLMEQYESVFYVHCQKPKSDDSIYAALEQRDTFKKLIDKFIIEPHRNNTEADICIFDRSWVGEYVYGTLYRNNSKKFVSDMIDRLNVNIDGFCCNWNADYGTTRKCEIYYILLEPCNAQFCLKKDDGKSMSENNLEKINQEIDLFSEAFDILDDLQRGNNIHVRRICVEDYITHDFFDINKIMEKVNSFISNL